MATKEKVKKTPAKKTSASKAKAENLGSTSGESIGFLRASEKAHIAVGDIPLTFMSDLGIMPEKMEKAKAFNRKFISGFYESLTEASEAPGKFKNFMLDKVRDLVARNDDEVEPVKAKPTAVKTAPKKTAVPKKATTKPGSKAKSKTATKPKAKAAVKKPKAAGAKPKAAPRAKAA